MSPPRSSRVDQLVLGALQGPPGSGATPGEIARRLRPLLPEDAGRSLFEAVQSALSRLASQDLVRRDGARGVLTAAGEARAEAHFGGNAFAARSRYRVLACALGVPPTPSLGTADGLRAEVLRQAYTLPLGPSPSLAQVYGALGWQLLPQGASSPVAERLQARGGFLQSTKTVLAALMFAELGIDRLPATLPDPAGLLAQATRRLAARARGLVSESSSDLRKQVVNDWLMPAAPEEAHREEPVDRFAASVVAAAKRSPTGWFGDDLVFISHAHRAYASGRSVSLPAFKAELLAAQRRGEVQLAVADMPQGLDPADLADSEIRYRSSTFHFVRLS